MGKLIVVAQVKDPVQWEKTFRTHGEMFKRDYALSKPASYGIGEGNIVTVCFDVDDVGAALKSMDSPATAEAMAEDGVMRETAKFYVLDKELQF